MDYPLYIYPHGTPLIFTGMTRMFLRNGYPKAWCLWQEMIDDTTFNYHQVAGDHYIKRTKHELSKEILQTFETSPINYIMPTGFFRIYMSFDDWDATYPYFQFMMDGATVYHKYQVRGYKDNWGILN